MEKSTFEQEIDKSRLKYKEHLLKLEKQMDKITKEQDKNTKDQDEQRREAKDLADYEDSYKDRLEGY